MKPSRARGVWEILGILFVLSALNSCQNSTDAPVGNRPPNNEVCFQKQCVQVELVYKPADLERGLKFRERLDKDAGMLFAFSRSGEFSFWMKDTWIPLDIIWLDSSRRVVHIENNVPPCKEDPCPVYPPHHEAMYVLEVNAGHARVMGIHLGDSAVFKIEP